MREKILAYLKKDVLDFNEGVRLLQSHPNHKKPVVHNMKLRPHWEVMQTRLIFELETLAGLPTTNRRATFTEAEHPYAASVNEELTAVELKIPFDKLTEKERKLITEKSQLYNHRDRMKKELAAIGTKNDEKSITRRAECMDEITRDTVRIKAIYAVLSKYIPDAKGKLPEVTPAIEMEYNKELDDEFHYMDMSDDERSKLLASIEAIYPGVKERAENSERKKQKAINQAYAARIGSMIRLLKYAYSETTESTDAIPATEQEPEGE